MHQGKLARPGPATGSLLQVNTKYMALAKAMLSYEKQCFSQWQEKVDQTAIQHLKLSILQESTEGNRCKHGPTPAHLIRTLSVLQPIFTTAV